MPFCKGAQSDLIRVLGGYLLVDLHVVVRRVYVKSMWIQVRLGLVFLIQFKLPQMAHMNAFL